MKFHAKKFIKKFVILDLQATIRKHSRSAIVQKKYAFARTTFLHHDYLHFLPPTHRPSRIAQFKLVLNLGASFAANRRERPFLHNNKILGGIILEFSLTYEILIDEMIIHKQKSRRNTSTRGTKKCHSEVSFLR